MSNFECVQDGICPDGIREAGRKGKLQVRTCIGWVNISEEDFQEVVCGNTYRIKQEDKL